SPQALRGDPDRRRVRLEERLDRDRLRHSTTIVADRNRTCPDAIGDDRRRMTESIPIEAFLEPYPPPIRIAAQRLRRLVFQVEPDAIERVREGWRIIGYDLRVGRRSRYFAWIGPEPKHVHIGFQRGVLMADPEHRLRGGHLRLKSVR